MFLSRPYNVISPCYNQCKPALYEYQESLVIHLEWPSTQCRHSSPITMGMVVTTISHYTWKQMLI